MLRCFIERSRGLSNALTPVYTLYSDNESALTTPTHLTQ
jgi:hypothetical protein